MEDQQPDQPVDEGGTKVNGPVVRSKKSLGGLWFSVIFFLSSILVCFGLLYVGNRLVHKYILLDDVKAQVDVLDQRFHFVDECLKIHIKYRQQKHLLHIRDFAGARKLALERVTSRPADISEADEDMIILMIDEPDFCDTWGVNKADALASTHPK